jgi:D-alanyl-D-alanine carboxypeptidase
LFLGAWLGLLACAQALEGGAWRAALIPACRELQAPGVVVYLDRPGREPLTLADGLADIQSGRAIEAGDPAGAGSITKMLIAVTLLQLEAEGRLSLDDPLSKYLPDFPRADKLPLRLLMQHRSGIPDFTDAFQTGRGELPAKILLGIALARQWTPEELTRLIANQPGAFPPDARCRYSNSNYILLGRVIERVTGNRVSAELRRRIIAPLGMASTVFAGEEPLPAVDIRCYALAEGQPVDTMPLENASFAWTAGALVSTPADLVRFARGLFEGGLLPPKQLAEMRRTCEMPGLSRYGLGLMERGSGDGMRLGHSGRTAGFSSELWYYPADRSVAVVTANLRECATGPLAHRAWEAARES